jgi:hypothetical protein
VGIPGYVKRPLRPQRRPSRRRRWRPKEARKGAILTQLIRTGPDPDGKDLSHRASTATAARFPDPNLGGYVTVIVQLKKKAQRAKVAISKASRINLDDLAEAGEVELNFLLSPLGVRVVIN